MTASPEDDDRRPSVRLYLDGTYAYAEPTSWLGEELFPVYRRAVGGFFDRKRRATRVHVDAVHDVISRLREAGFHADPDRALVEAHLQTTAQRWYDLQTVRDRVAMIEQELFETCGRRLFPHQRPGAEWLATRFRGLLADEPGVAKTLQAIVALPANAPTIVVAPAGVKGSWMGEIERCRPQLRPIMLEGRRSFRWPEEGEVLLTNYDILPQMKELHDPPCEGLLPRRRCRGCGPEEEYPDLRAGIMLKRRTHLPGCDGLEPEADRLPCPGCGRFLKEARPGTVLILDEVHLCKNPDAGRTRVVRLLARAVRDAVQGRNWGLTGTPIKSEARDLWYVLDVLGLAGEAFGSWDAFAEIFKAKKVDKRLVWGVPDDRAASALQTVALRRTKAEVFPDMPDKLWQEVVVPIGRSAIAECSSVAEAYGGVDEMIRILETETLPFSEISRISAAVASAKSVWLQKYIGDFENDDRAEDGGYADPLVVFSVHRTPIDAFEGRKDWAIISGEVKSGRDRQRIVDDFQKGRYRGIACTSSAAGTGITLTRSHRMIHVDLDWNPSDVEQVSDRIHRAGQTERCLYWVLKADHPLDRRITEITLRKMAVIQASVGAAAVEGVGDVRIEEEIRRMQEEIACGRAVRRLADTDERRDLLEAIASAEFATRRQDRLASDLSEQARTIGLSDRQWELVASLVSESRPSNTVSSERSTDVRTNEVDEVVSVRYEDSTSSALPEPSIEGRDGMIEVRGDPHLFGCARVEDAWAECTCGSVSAREDEMAEDDSDTSTTELPPEVREIVDRIGKLGSEDRIDALVEAVDVLTDEERDQLFAELDALYGGDEDEDEDEDEDGPEEDEADDDDGSP